MQERHVEIGIGEIYTTTSPEIISTILGSCVSVCIWSEGRCSGGMIHFALPDLSVTHNTTRSDYNFGDLAIKELITRLLTHEGVTLNDLKAKITGGSHALGVSEIGRLNVQIARDILAKMKIPVVSEDVGGPQGRKIFFYTRTGRLRVALLETSNAFHPLAFRKILAIGASTGGTQAITNLLSQLPAQIPPVVIVQHIPPVFSEHFAKQLNELFSFEVKEACDGDELLKNRVLIAPGGKHMEIFQKEGAYRVKIYEGEKVNGHCPSVDVMFSSLARLKGTELLGVILTGMGHDGCEGLLSMKRRGAVTIAQDEATSVVYGMPKAAADINAVEHVLPLHEMGAVIVKAMNSKK